MFFSFFEFIFQIKSKMEKKTIFLETLKKRPFIKTIIIIIAIKLNNIIFA
jgi:hypothetical protein